MSITTLESLEDWTKSLDHGTDVNVILYDFKKAFDTLSHSKLILKLESYGIRGNILHWINDFLTNRTQEVVINQVHSSTQKVLSGVPQGSVLGPILFLVFINDPTDLAETTVILFADDTKTYSTINTDNDVENLQRTTDKLYDWFIEWDIDFNEKKCKRLHLGKKETNHSYFMKTKDLNRIQISNVKEENDLGVIIDNKLTFDAHISCTINIVNRDLGIINRSFKYMDNTMFLQLYKSLVRPHLEYASQVWSPYLKKHQIALENVRRRATKLIKNLSQLSYKERLLQLGLPSLEYRRMRADTLQVYKILNNIESSNTELRRTSFSIRVVDSWNNLIHEIVNAQVLIHSRISSTVFGNIILPSLSQYATPKVQLTVESMQTEGSLEVTDLPMILEQ